MLELGNSAGVVVAAKLACRRLTNEELEELVFVLTGAQRGPSRPALNGRFLVGCTSRRGVARSVDCEGSIWSVASLSMAFDSGDYQSRAQTDCLNARAQAREGRTGPNPGGWAVEHGIRACSNVGIRPGFHPAQSAMRTFMCGCPTVMGLDTLVGSFEIRAWRR